MTVEVEARNFAIFYEEAGKGDKVKWMNLGCVLVQSLQDLLMGSKRDMGRIEIRVTSRFLVKQLGKWC